VTPAAAGDIWIFGYGSLMWKPGFPHDEAVKARLTGYRRCFCIYSTNHRGSGTRPGLVLGLDRGGVCDGVALRVTPSHARATLDYLRDREQVHGVYRETLVPVRLDDGSHRSVMAQAYIVERAHPSYVGRLSLGQQAALITGARGISGVNLDYLINTVAQLAKLGIREPELERLLGHIGACVTRPGGRQNGDAMNHPSATALLSVVRRRPFDAHLLKLGERRRFIYRRQIAVWASKGPPAARD
jgi:glutathione-specific gamma-glutamylcyclotransferase